MSITAQLLEVLNEVTQIRDIPSVILNLMKEVEKLKKLRGREKKRLILNAIREWNDHHSESINHVIDVDLVSDMIDTFSDLDKGKIGIVVKRCFGLCC